MSSTTKLAQRQGPPGGVFQKTAFWLVATNIMAGRPSVSHVVMTTGVGILLGAF